jgi:hypothetical protein
MSNNFDFTDYSFYKRELDVAKTALSQYSHFLQIEKGITKEQADAFLREHVIPKIKDPEMTVLKKNEFGDRFLNKTTYLGHINQAIQTENILVPCLTQYLPSKVMKSPIASFMVKNIAKRKAFKKLEAVAEAKKDVSNSIFYGTLQKAKKTSNNSVSGALTVASTGLKNASGHQTLTSICRITTAIGNGHTERCLSGTRLYFDCDTALANMVSLISGTDINHFDSILKKYNLVYPTQEQVYDCIMRSLSLYTVRMKDENILKSFISKLNDTQRAVIVYTGDLYHIRLCNDSFMKKMIDDLSVINITGEVEDENPVKWLYSVHEKILIHTKQLVTEYAVDQDPDIGKWPKENMLALYHTTKALCKALEKYESFIRCIFTNNHLPPRVGSFPNSVRRVVLGGDTDSTFFTVQDWCIWKNDSIIYDKEYVKVVSVMNMLVSITLVHYLAYFSSQMGVDKENLFTVEMKNEFRFDVMLMTLMTKHYASIIGAKEGNMTSKKKYEVKGANFISSAIPKVSLDSCDSILKKDIIESLQTTGKVNLKEIITKIANAEAMVINSVNDASSTILRKSKIKSPQAYKNAESTPSYQQHLLWTEVFAPKYGRPPDLPYATLSVNTNTNTKTKMNDFINSMEDKELAMRMVTWMQKHKREYLSSYMMPQALLNHTGIPKELRSVIDYRKVVRKACTNHYLLAQALGVYPDNENRTVIEWLGGQIEDHI